MGFWSANTEYPTIITRSAFHIDCTGIIPACEFKCPQCVQEIESTFALMQGVSKCYMEDEAEGARIIVEHDPNLVTAEKLMDTFRRLPSFYKGFFVPELRQT